MKNDNTETIAAIATPPGKGGVGIIRISGPAVTYVAQSVLNFIPTPRHAHYCAFMDGSAKVDEGLAIYFPGPNSFTGEDVLELQGHGGPIVLDMLLSVVLKFGIRLANPGEFSERAFLNDKIDLLQAEAISDLIESSSEQAAKSAISSLQGEFSNKINGLVEEIIHLRMFVEAAIDFPEEEIDFLSDSKVGKDLISILDTVDNVFYSARQGSLIREGMTVVIAGKPNAGKSSLLNALSGKDSAIVTEIEGTTRDVLREQINIDGMPLHIVDTAGLRDSKDIVEKIGIEKAWNEINQADRILFLYDGSDASCVESDPKSIWPEFFEKIERKDHITIVQNKIDLTKETPNICGKDYPIIKLSAKNSLGIDLLKSHLKECVGYESTSEGKFMARRRHLDALKIAKEHLLSAKTQLEQEIAGELVAEDLRLAQLKLSEITGAFTPDDLLGQIFSSFCIGK